MFDNRINIASGFHELRAYQYLSPVKQVNSKWTIANGWKVEESTRNKCQPDSLSLFEWLELNIGSVVKSAISLSIN